MKKDQFCVELFGVTVNYGGNQKMWRPDNWLRYEDYNTPSWPHQGGDYFDNSGKFVADQESFEQGADAMLKAIESELGDIFNGYYDDPVVMRKMRKWLDKVFVDK